MKKLKKIISTIVLVSFAVSNFTTPAGAQWPTVSLTGSFQPPVLLGLKIHPENPLLFDFIVDYGDSQLSEDQLENETEKLVKYFLAALTIPEKEVWVNLSPSEKDRIIPDILGQTVMGKTMLEQDYLLKQLASSLTDPQTELGKRYWQKAGAVPTLSKVWIMPQKAEVLESDGIVLIGEKQLMVKMQQENSEVFEDIILPVINKEVNESKDFADVRQIYNSVILATWYKQALKESLLGKVYADKGKIVGIESDDRATKERIYDQYMMAFKNGAYNLIREEEDKTTGDIIPRKYFAGGITIAEFGQGASSALTTKEVSRGRIQSLLLRAKAAIVEVLGKESRKTDPSKGYQKIQDAENGNYYARGDLSNGVLYRIYDSAASYSYDYEESPELREKKIFDLLAMEGLTDFVPQVIETGSMRSPLFMSLVLGEEESDLKGYLKGTNQKAAERIVSLTAWGKVLPGNIRKYFGQSGLQTLKGFFNFRAAIDELFKVYGPDRARPIMSIAGYIGDVVSIKDNVRKAIGTTPYLALSVPKDAQFLGDSAIWNSLSFVEKMEALIDFVENLDRIHNLGIIHNNLSRRSVLVSREAGKVRLIPVDFAYSYIPGQELDPRYTVDFQSKDPNARHKDIMSLGFMLGELFDKAQLESFVGERIVYLGISLIKLNKDDPQPDDMKTVADRLRALKAEYEKTFISFDKLKDDLYGPQNSTASSGVRSEQEQKEINFTFAVEVYRGERINRAFTTILWWARQNGYHRPFMLRDGLDTLIRKSPEFQDDYNRARALTFLKLIGVLIQYGMTGDNESQQRMGRLLAHNYNQFSGFYDLVFNEELTNVSGAPALYSRINGDVTFHSEIFSRASDLLSDAQEKEFVERYRARYPQIQDFISLEQLALSEDQTKTRSGMIWDDLIKFTEEKIAEKKILASRSGGYTLAHERARQAERDAVDKIADDFFLEVLLPQLSDKDYYDRAIFNIVLRELFYEHYYIHLWGGESIADALKRKMDPRDLLTDFDLPTRGRMNKAEADRMLETLGFNLDGTPGDGIREPLKKALAKLVASSATQESRVKQALFVVETKRIAYMVINSTAQKAFDQAATNAAASINAFLSKGEIDIQKVKEILAETQDLSPEILRAWSDALESLEKISPSENQDQFVDLFREFWLEVLGVVYGNASNSDRKDADIIAMELASAILKQSDLKKALADFSRLQLEFLAEGVVFKAQEGDGVAIAMRNAVEKSRNIEGTSKDTGFQRTYFTQILLTAAAHVAAASSGLVLDSRTQQMVADTARNLIGEILKIDQSQIPDGAADFVGIVVLTAMFTDKWFERHPVVGGDGKLFNIVNTDVLGLSDVIFDQFQAQRKFLGSLGFSQREFLSDRVLVISDQLGVAITRAYAQLKKRVDTKELKPQKIGEVILSSQAERLAHILLTAYDSREAGTTFARLAQPAAYALTQTSQSTINLSQFADSYLGQDREIDQLVRDTWKSILVDFNIIFGSDVPVLKTQYGLFVMKINQYLQSVKFQRTVPQERVLRVTAIELAIRILSAPDSARAYTDFLRFANRFLADFENAADGGNVELWLRRQDDPLNGEIKKSFETLKAIDGKYILGSVTLMLALTTQICVSASSGVDQNLLREDFELINPGPQGRGGQISSSSATELKSYDARMLPEPKHPLHDEYGKGQELAQLHALAMRLNDKTHPQYEEAIEKIRQPDAEEDVVSFPAEVLRRSRYDETLRVIWVAADDYNQFAGTLSRQGFHNHDFAFLPSDGELLFALHERRHNEEPLLRLGIETEIDAYMGSFAELIELAQMGLPWAQRELEEYTKPISQDEINLKNQYPGDVNKQAVAIYGDRVRGVLFRGSYGWLMQKGNRDLMWMDRDGIENLMTVVIGLMLEDPLNYKKEGLRNQLTGLVQYQKQDDFYNFFMKYKRFFGSDWSLLRGQKHINAIRSMERSSPANVGGIDFDPTNMNLQIKRDGRGVPLPLLQQNIEQIDIQGLFPVIINVVPVNSQTLPLFLGQQSPSSEGQVAALP